MFAARFCYRPWPKQDSAHWLCTSLPAYCQPLFVPDSNAASDLMPSCSIFTRPGLMNRLCLQLNLAYPQCTTSCTLYHLISVFPKFYSLVSTPWHLYSLITPADPVSMSRGALGGILYKMPVLSSWALYTDTWQNLRCIHSCIPQPQPQPLWHHLCTCSSCCIHSWNICYIQSIHCPLRFHSTLCPCCIYSLSQRCTISAPTASHLLLATEHLMVASVRIISRTPDTFKIPLSEKTGAKWGPYRCWTSQSQKHYMQMQSEIMHSTQAVRNNALQQFLIFSRST